MSEVKIRFSVRAEPPFVVVASDPWHIDVDRHVRVHEESVRADKVTGVSVVRTHNIEPEDHWGVILEGGSSFSGSTMLFDDREAAERFAADVRRCVMSSGLWRRG